MATFITTIKFTEKGIQSINESPKRTAAFRIAAKKMGVKISGIYWTLGLFDGVIIFDAPDASTATAVMLKLSAQGNVQTTTVCAFDATEMESIVGLLSKRK